MSRWAGYSRLVVTSGRFAPGSRVTAGTGDAFRTPLARRAAPACAAPEPGRAGLGARAPVSAREAPSPPSLGPVSTGAAFQAEPGPPQATRVAGVLRAPPAGHRKVLVVAGDGGLWSHGRHERGDASREGAVPVRAPSWVWGCGCRWVRTAGGDARSGRPPPWACRFRRGVRGRAAGLAGCLVTVLLTGLPGSGTEPVRPGSPGPWTWSELDCGLYGQTAGLADVFGLGTMPYAVVTARDHEPASRALASATSMPCRRSRFSPRILRLAWSVSCG